MVKSDLITRISQRVDTLPVKVISMSINQIIEKLIENLCSGQRIEIRGFGSFSLHFRQSRKARNPMTGDTVATIPKYTPHFKPGKELRDKLNESYLKFLETETEAAVAA